MKISLKPFIGCSLKKLVSAAVPYGILCGLCLPVAAQFPPPGLIQSIDFTDQDPVSLTVPFTPVETNPAKAFSGQLEDSGLVLFQWSGGLQQWQTSIYLPGIGWTGDTVHLALSKTLLLESLQPGSYRLSLTGHLPLNPPEQTIFPGFNLVGAPEPAPLPMTAWSWDLLGSANADSAEADTLFSVDNVPQAWLSLDGTDPVWTGFDIPGAPGHLTPGTAYYYRSTALQSFDATGNTSATYDDQLLPAVTDVTYDADEDRVLVTIETPGGPDNTLDLYYQDVTFPEGFTPTDNWNVWTLGLDVGPGDHFVIEDEGDQDRPHPRIPSMRFYQVGDGLADSDSDGFSDSLEQLLLGTDPLQFDDEEDVFNNVDPATLYLDNHSSLQVETLPVVKTEDPTFEHESSVVYTLDKEVKAVPVDLNGWTSAPWNGIPGSTSFSGILSDVDYMNGANVTITFQDPRSGVDITDPANPDASSSSASTFGMESTGFGVGGTGVGRFDRGESFVIQSDHLVRLNGIRFAEYSGDESVHIAWIRDGVSMSKTIDFDPGTFYTTVYVGQLVVDPDTAVTLTNVSASGSAQNGRLRINRVEIDLLEAPLRVPQTGDVHRLSGWSGGPWHGESGDTSLSGFVTDNDWGTVEFTFADPRAGVDIDNVGAPDATSSETSIFGLEATGFGVGETAVGRFERGESFVVQAEQAFALKSIGWNEYSGDEYVHMSWISGGTPMSATFEFESGGFYTELSFSGVYVDADTPLTITNVTPGGAYLNGRLRVNFVDVALIDDAPAVPFTPEALLVLPDWTLWPWDPTGWDSSIMHGPSLPQITPFLTRQAWWDVPGSHIANLTTDSRFPWHPDQETEVTPVFETPADSGDDDFGQRVIGRFHPPQTGYYRFQLAAGGSANLWLNTPDLLRTRIATVPDTTGVGQWDTYPQQTSDLIWMEAGTAYPMEAIMKEGTGGDHLSVAATFPAGNVEAPLGATHFVPQDLSGMVDPESDSDGDGLTLLEETLLGTDPDVFTTTPANAPALTSHLWNSFDGTPAGLAQHSGFPYFPDATETLGDYYEAPENVGDDYGRHLFGRFHAPADGEYTFWIASDGAGELWITHNGIRTRITEVPGNTAPREWDKYPAQQSVSVTLSAGESYALEALHTEQTGSDHLSVGVQLPDNRYERPIRSRRFLTPLPEIFFTQDTDGDGLSDYEEWVFETDPELSDSSGDGISDFDAVVLNLDPLAQHPEPLIPAWWVLQYDIDSAALYIYEDFNDDGLTNLEEYLNGTHPYMSDSSGDGIHDVIAIYQAGVNPLDPVFDGTRVVLHSLKGREALDPMPGWEVHGDLARTIGYGGLISFSFNLTEGGHLGLAFAMRNKYAYTKNDNYSFRLFIDDEEVLRQPYLIEHGQETEVLWIPGPLEAGERKVTLRWDYKPQNGTLELLRLDVVELGGPDTSGDGTFDWIEQRLQRPALNEPNGENWVSPLFLEGNKAVYGGVAVSGEVNEVLSQAEVKTAPKNRWYANVPLSEAHPTEIRVDWANESSWEAAVTWDEFNLLSNTPDHLTIRLNDSLLLNARPPGAESGTVDLTIGTIHYSLVNGEPVVHTFETPGIHEIQGVWSHGSETESRTITVEVIAGELAEEIPGVWVGHSRNWVNPDLPGGLFHETDYDVTVTDSTLSGGGRKLVFDTDVDGTRHLVSRIYENGPVLDSRKIESFTNFSSAKVYVRQIEVLHDGTRHLEMGISGQFPVPGLLVKLNIHAAGVVFENGTNLLELTEEDFDETGFKPVSFYLPPGVNLCHQLRIYQNGVFVGRR